ncbi:ABC transporter substrate-binding protein [Fusobacterium varium]|uniref:ABC transporter substrate-binding protein n=1 Tax=Fusobacterium varium TaxID=856 RepID=UPI000E3FB89A|nr:ABC transporter substrate-binding protein [Fusobacterium varium]MCI6033819.1 ABC transporter substrate-binding protein [Fusobacterium varium]RGJ30948.1 ABC transporter substrate-binding protein [Fusobacterium varium]
MKKLFILLLVILVTACGTEKQKKIEIGITQIVEHPSLDDVRKGIIDALKANGYDENKININYKNAQGDFGTAQVIAQEYNNKSDVIIAISTPSAQAAANNIKDKPIFFSAITNPESAGILRKNVTGVSDKSPVKKQVELIEKLLPEAKNIGIVYNTSEQNSFYLTEEFTKAAKEKGYIVKVKGISNISEMASALDTLLPTIDVLYTSIDNTIASTYPLIVEKSNKADKPIIGATKSFVEQGALAVDGISDYQVGYQTGEMVARYLNGEKIENIPYEVVEKSEMYINKDIAKRFGIKGE